MDAQKAISFVTANGSDLEIARLRHILFARKPETEVVQPFLALQSGRGGFPLRMQAGNPETVDNTLTALWWLDELGMLSVPAGQNALRFLLAVQNEDGGWDEDVSLEEYDLPPWIQPGDLNTRLYLSAYACYWLAAGGYKADPGLERAMSFLLPYQQESGRFLGYLHTTWIAASACLMAGHTEPAGRSIQALLDWPIAYWEDSQIAWVLDCLHRGGITRDHELVEILLTRLLAGQGSEGKWASEDGESFAVSTTIEALKVFKLYDQLPGILT